MNKSIEERLSELEARNEKVDSDKRWERHPARIIMIVLLTYIFAVLFIWLADVSNPFLGATVPAVAFSISLLSANFIRKIIQKKTA